MACAGANGKIKNETGEEFGIPVPFRIEFCFHLVHGGKARSGAEVERGVVGKQIGDRSVCGCCNAAVVGNGRDCTDGRGKVGDSCLHARHGSV